MNKTFSAYLDGIRFLAALTVFLGHAAGKFWTGGFLWPLGAYGDTCVVVFFVLSGFVIAYVCDVKERDWRSYSVNRVARLWSVVLPALVLTSVIDYFGVRVAPELYLGQPWFDGSRPVLQYVASLFMVQEAWHAKLLPGINEPFWSLTYEAIYYVAFGVVLFCKGHTRWILAALALAVGGPLVAALFPIWLLGYLAYHLKNKTPLLRPGSIVLFALSSVLLIGAPHLRAMLPSDIIILGEPVLSRYIDATAFFLNLVAANSIAQWLRVSDTFQRRVSVVASTTFVIYLFHRPLIQFFSYVGPADPSNWFRRVLVVLGTLAICFAATPATEMFRRYLRARLTRVFAQRNRTLVSQN